MFTIAMGDGTNATIDTPVGTPAGGPVDPSMPLVLLIPGMGGPAADMTMPLASRGAVAFDRTATFPPYTDAGFHPSPPLQPVAGFFADPPMPAVTSWRDALLAAGFATVSYEPAAPGGLMMPNVTQLAGLVAGTLATDARVKDARLAIVGHSRGGLIARALLVQATTDPTLANFLGRMTTVVTVHTPNTGSMLPVVAASVDALAATLQTTLAGLGLPPSPLLATLRGTTGSPALAELAPGSGVLTALAAAEPVPGISYHTFGGTNTQAMRLWVSLFTPDSGIPLPIPWPLFHWGTAPVMLGALIDALSFVPAQILVPVPLVTQAILLMEQLAAAAPELQNGVGDVLVTDARSHLPFETSHTTNSLNHLEALWDPMLQRQVVTILGALRITPPRRDAVATITPYPVSTTTAGYTVRASDAADGAGLDGTVTVTGTAGQVLVSQRLTAGAGGSFTVSFRPTRRRVFDPDTRTWTTELTYPDVQVQPDPTPRGSYDPVTVDIGL